MVSERDRVLIELKAKGLDIEASLRKPWRQMVHADIIASALGVSVLLLFYYTAVGFGVIYLVFIFHFSVNEANALGNWAWASNAVALVIGGLISDHFRVRKPFMVIGGVGGLVLTAIYAAEVGQSPSFTLLAVITSVQSIFIGIAYVSWMASFTETVEARNPALTATGLAVWGWLLRLIVTASLVVLPMVVSSMNTLVMAPAYLAQYNRMVMANVTPPAALVAQLRLVQSAAAAAPEQWRIWFGICNAGVIVFVATVFVMRGRWSPAHARQDEAAHDEMVARELAEFKQHPVAG
jgi:MFS family permease